MNQTNWNRRGWICAAIGPVACVLFVLGRMAGVWEPGKGPVFTVLAAILMVEMLVGTVAPFWWIFTYFRRRKQLKTGVPVVLFANAAALVVSIYCFF